MPYALDVLYCQIPGDGDWTKIVIGELPAVLGDEEEGLAKLSTLLAQGDVDEGAPAVLGDESIDDVVPSRVYTGGLLGVERATPAIVDLSASIGARADRGGAAVELVVIYPAIGPAADDLAEAAQPDGRLYHYYVDLTGAIARLADEAQAARAAGGATWRGQGELDRRSIAVGVERAIAGLAEDQVSSLAWLLNDLKGRHGLAAGQVIQASDLGISEPIAGWGQVVGQ
jgi:hypothetical protein